MKPNDDKVNREVHLIRKFSDPFTKLYFWTASRADRGPINLVPSVCPSATGISRERFIQFFRKLGI